METKQILIVVTNHDMLGDTGLRTGVWLDEFATPYYLWKEHGYQLSVASRDGGVSPIDPESLKDSTQTYYTKKYLSEKHPPLKNTLPLSAINPEDFYVVYYPGGHGPLWDLAADPENAELLEKFYHAGKLIVAVCHGPAALLGAKKTNGKSILDQEKITGFSNQEEWLVKLNKVVPFLLEDRIRATGAAYCSDQAWEPYVICSNQFITGQNPKSAVLVAEAVIRRVDAKICADRILNEEMV